MSLLELSDVEARVIGCLIEKSVVTPDQYPLTLSSLTNACNQKTSRDPIMSLDQGTVQRTVRDLERKNLARVDENFRGRAERYVQRFCNTRYSDLQFEPPALAIVCLLLLRGAQTPGELRSRSGRLHTFADTEEVLQTLRTLMADQDEPIVARLPMTAGRRDHEYMHLFYGPIDSAPMAARSPVDPQATPRGRDELEERVAELEKEVKALRELVSSRPNLAD
ncbi:MAG: DUF480 domain-containing protein [Pseudomonadota bacterium]